MHSVTPTTIHTADGGTVTLTVAGPDRVDMHVISAEGRTTATVYMSTADALALVQAAAGGMPELARELWGTYGVE